jgi:hypothetical protein
MDRISGLQVPNDGIGYVTRRMPGAALRFSQHIAPVKRPKPQGQLMLSSFLSLDIALPAL